MKLFYLTRRETQCGLVGADRLTWGRRDPSATQGTREVGDVDSGPLVASGGTQPAHLTPPPFSHSPKADPWKPRQDRIFFSLPIGRPGQQKVGSPIRKKEGGVVKAEGGLLCWLVLLPLLSTPRTQNVIPNSLLAPSKNLTRG